MGETEKLKNEIKRAREELQQFAYIASHDLQEPLRTITTYSNFLAKRYKDKIDDEGQEFLDFIQSGGKKIQDMINGLLSYSRIQTKGEELKEVDPNQIVQYVLQSLHTSLKEVNAVVNVDKLPSVMADAKQLQEAFYYILDNAIKFRDKNRPLEIQIKGTLQNDMLSVAISDNGIGIKSEFFDRIFLLFQRLHTYSEIPGRGIGLTLAKKIIDRHGGTAAIESTPNKGTTLTFTLPLANKLSKCM